MSLKLVLFIGWVAVAKAGLVQPIRYDQLPAHSFYPGGYIDSHLGGFPQHISPGFRIAGPLPTPNIYPRQLLTVGGHIAPAPVPAPIIAKTVVSADYDPNPQYTFSYDVQDAITGDNKNQVETRNGDSVQGSYSLNDPDGTRRTVDYTADSVNGFNAVVRKEPLTRAIAKVAAPLTVAGPAYARIEGAPLPLIPHVKALPLFGRAIIH